MSLIFAITCFLSMQSIFGAPDFRFTNLEKSNLDANFLYKRDCKCVKFKDCSSMVGLITKAKLSERTYLYDKIRKASCGFADSHPLVCCPPNPSNSDEAYTIEIEDRQPWVWDTTKLYNHNNNKNNQNNNNNNNNNNSNRKHNNADYDDADEEHNDENEHINNNERHNNNRNINNNNKNNNVNDNNNQNSYDDRNNNKNDNVPKKSKKKFTRKIHYNFEDYEANFERNLVDFEDPQTKKNCPKRFYDGFEDEIDLGSKTKHIKQYDPQEYDSFDAKYGYPPPSGFRFSKLEPTEEAVTPSEEPSKRILLNSEYCGLSVNTRIVGGRDSGPGQFPWVARVGYLNKTSQKPSYRCAGSVINERYVITAAHCVTNLIDDLEVSHIRIGEERGKRKQDCDTDPVLCRVPQDYSIERIIAHPNYDSPKYANDIALIRIIKPDSSIPLTPICLPFNNLGLLDEELTGRMAIVAGWSSNIGGINDPSDEVANKKPGLQYVRLPIVNRTACAITYAQFSANSWTPIFIESSQICVQGRENMDACQGDSGGPLMDDGSSDNSFRYTLMGLVSFGPRTCGVSNFPGVYTRVASFLDWILTNMQP